MADYYYRQDDDYYSSDEELSAAIERSFLTYNTVPELAQLPPIDSAEAFPSLPSAVPRSRAQAGSSGITSLPEWSATGPSALRQAPAAPALPQSKVPVHAKAAKASATASTQLAAPKAAAKQRGQCFSWQQGRCRRGAACKFEHSVQPASGTAAAAATAAPAGARPCQFYAQGKCKKGNDCNFSHASAPLAPTIAAARAGTRKGIAGASIDSSSSRQQPQQTAAAAAAGLTLQSVSALDGTSASTPASLQGAAAVATVETKHDFGAVYHDAELCSAVRVCKTCGTQQLYSSIFDPAGLRCAFDTGIGPCVQVEGSSSGNTDAAAAAVQQAVADTAFSSLDAAAHDFGLPVVRGEFDDVRTRHDCLLVGWRRYGRF